MASWETKHLRLSASGVNWWTRELAGLIEANNSRDRLTRGTLLPVKALVHVKHEQISEPKSARIGDSGPGLMPAG